jgi:2-keto-4-pentenoate hydratase/2-oxohepta-3-ene-1,7-dioic acid hydratase in catechol pathway
MKIAKFRSGGVIRTGIVTGDLVQALHQSLDELIAGASQEPLGRPVPLASVELLAPLTVDCRGLLCCGINYVEHQRESADLFVSTVPEHPIVFFKTPGAVADPYAVLELNPHVSREFDWEVELGVVIGKAGREIRAEDAGAHVFGYTVVNDVTARDVQHRHKQWHLGKNVDRSTPVGPWLVTADELGYPPALDIELTVNGVRKQHATTRDMVFDIAEQIAVISRYVELRPGDVLATGTPAGVGFARTPAEFLRDGDVVEASIEGIGSVRNKVRALTPGHATLAVSA